MAWEENIERMSAVYQNTLKEWESLDEEGWKAKREQLKEELAALMGKDAAAEIAETYLDGPLSEKDNRELVVAIKCIAEEADLSLREDGPTVDPRMTVTIPGLKRYPPSLSETLVLKELRDIIAAKPLLTGASREIVEELEQQLGDIMDPNCPDYLHQVNPEKNTPLAIGLKGFAAAGRYDPMLRRMQSLQRAGGDTIGLYRGGTGFQNIHSKMSAQNRREGLFWGKGLSGMRDLRFGIAGLKKIAGIDKSSKLYGSELDCVKALLGMPHLQLEDPSYGKRKEEAASGLKTPDLDTVLKIDLAAGGNSRSRKIEDADIGRFMATNAGKVVAGRQILSEAAEANMACFRELFRAGAVDANNGKYVISPMSLVVIGDKTVKELSKALLAETADYPESYQELGEGQSVEKWCLRHLCLDAGKGYLEQLRLCSAFATASVSNDKQVTVIRPQHDAKLTKPKTAPEVLGMHEQLEELDDGTYRVVMREVLQTNVATKYHGTQEVQAYEMKREEQRPTYEQKEQVRPSMNLWQRFWSHFGFYKEEVSKIAHYEAVVNAADTAMREARLSRAEEVRDTALNGGWSVRLGRKAELKHAKDPEGKYRVEVIQEEPEEELEDTLEEQEPAPKPQKEKGRGK